MMKHLRSHIGDNVYQCELCPQAFPMVKDLRQHFTHHINDTEEEKRQNLEALKEKESQLKKLFQIP